LVLEGGIPALIGQVAHKHGGLAMMQYLASPQWAEPASSGGLGCRRYSHLQARILAGEQFLAALTGNPESVVSTAEAVSS
jgi:hypothetical protein